MLSKNKVIINKKFLKKVLVEQEDLGKTLSRFIDNSIKAGIDKASIENPSQILINIYNDLIIIKDNSGGIKENINSSDIFRIGNNHGELITGLGIKKSFLKLGNKIEILSNNKELSRKFVLDITSDEEELQYESEYIPYNINEKEGTTIFISKLNENIKNDLIIEDTIGFAMGKLGGLYKNFINKGNLEIFINNERVKPLEIKGRLINKRDILNNYSVSIYKGERKEFSGVDLFINDFIIYEREKSKEVKWNLLNEHKYSYKNCIVEINYYGDEKQYFKDKEVLFNNVIAFIKENRGYFKSDSVIIQYEEPVDKVEELKKYYDCKTAKEVGVKGFNKVYEEYLNDKLI